VSANSPQLDVDDAACPELDRRQRVPSVVDALVETNWSLDQPLQLRMGVYIVPTERLLHHE